MNNKKTVFILAAALVVILGAAALLYPKLSASAPSNLGGATSSGSSEPQTVPAPSFPLLTPEGDELDLEELVGEKPVVLNFWASTCPPCKEEMPDFQAAYEAYGQDINFVMVNVGDAMQGETREKADTYLAEAGYTFPVYFDVDYQGITAYGVQGFPHTYFIDAEGNVVIYAAGMLTAQGLQQGLNLIAPDLVEAP